MFRLQSICPVFWSWAFPSFLLMGAFVLLFFCLCRDPLLGVFFPSPSFLLFVLCVAESLPLTVCVSLIFFYVWKLSSTFLLSWFRGRDAMAEAFLHYNWFLFPMVADGIFFTYSSFPFIIICFSSQWRLMGFSPLIFFQWLGHWFV